MITDRKTLVEKVALAIQLADECEIPDDYSLGLDPNVSDWGAFLADAVIDLIMGEAAKVAEGDTAEVRCTGPRRTGKGDERMNHYETRCPSCGGSDEQGCYADCPTTVITALTAENKRLRKALREYECHCPTSVCEWFPCGKTARNALEER